MKQTAEDSHNLSLRKIESQIEKCQQECDANKGQIMGWKITFEWVKDNLYILKQNVTALENLAEQGVNPFTYLTESYHELLDKIIDKPTPYFAKLPVDTPDEVENEHNKLINGDADKRTIFVKEMKDLATRIKGNVSFSTFSDVQLKTLFEEEKMRIFEKGAKNVCQIEYETILGIPGISEDEIKDFLKALVNRLYTAVREDFNKMGVISTVDNMDSKVIRNLYDSKVEISAMVSYYIHFSSYEFFKEKYKEMTKEKVSNQPTTPPDKNEHKSHEADKKLPDEFKLEEAFFKQSQPEGIPQDYIAQYLDIEIRKRASKFQDFINELAREGYIKDEVSVKYEFAYVVTGRGYHDPKRQPVLWHRKPANLFFLVKCFFPNGGNNNQDKYKRTEEIFKPEENFTEEWEKYKGKRSQYTNRVERDFKELVKRHYPGLDDFNTSKRKESNILYHDNSTED